MKSLIILSQWVLFSLMTPTLMAQDASTPKIVTETIQVEGVCQQCKQRIEKAALIKGVRYATWDPNQQELKVIYRTKTVQLKDIENAIAQTGHNTENVQADESAYEQLPSCCAYKTVTPH